MPFDFGGAGQNMGTLTQRAAEGLKNVVKSAYGYDDDTAYRHMGISSMNGITDNSETVTLNDFNTILAYANQHHLARLTFWSANRDRPCPGRLPERRHVFGRFAAGVGLHADLRPLRRLTLHLEMPLRPPYGRQTPARWP